MGKRVLITGGGGSIGSELCRQILTLQPTDIILIDHAEYPLYKIEQEMRTKAGETRWHAVLASVTDAAAMQHWFQHFQPHIVFHAAAYKHVPLLESRMREAVLNNVVGTQIVAEASMAAQVEKFILISTDKAVNPSNLMGATKRLAELYCQIMNQPKRTQFITVRFGNVLGSTGSVVPLFHAQLKAGGPLTVTHPEMERFFMTIPEACQLILQATSQGQGGEIFVLDMGDPIKISYLAEQMIRLSGREIEIVYTGLRPGEKLYEELFYLNESLVKTESEKLFKALCEPISKDALLESLQLMAHACMNYDETELMFLIRTWVPTYGAQPVTA